MTPTQSLDSEIFVIGVFSFIGIRFMVIYFCRNCWNEIGEKESVCLKCGAKQSDLDRETFISKLIRALKHPESETPIRAAKILGKLEAREAIPALIEILHHSKDFYIVAAAVEALGDIGDKKVIKDIRELLVPGVPLPVRVAAERTLRKLEST